MDKEFFSVGEVQAYLGSSRSFTYSQVLAKLQPHYLGRRVYFKKADLLKLLEEGKK